MVQWFKHFWMHRIFVSVALSETGAVTGMRLRTAWIATIFVAPLFVFSVWTLIGAENRAQLAAHVGGKLELGQYLARITELEEERDFKRQQVETIAQELGILQARLDRFDVLGEKLMADEIFDEFLDESEQAQMDGQGGPTFSMPEEVPDVTELEQQVGLLRQQADRAERALEVGLALALRNREDNAGVPHFWPVMHKRAYPSSAYGWRTDPFNKKRKWHSGIDIAAGWNAPIVSAADGIVVFSGYRYAYGMMVEIRHAGGFSTRYGHLKSTTVKNGDRVKAGDLVALMGSTGRSTGPHLHFEVLLNDQKIDPYPLVRDSRAQVRAMAREGRGDALVSRYKEDRVASR
jgi:murein DD-endopeptidase MepM/ murein hydrolase activator NlpD